MKIIKRTLLTSVLLFTTILIFSQNDILIDSKINKKEKYSEHKHSIGSTIFLIGNIDTKEPPMFLQLNYGYELTPKDIIIAEAITWAYYRPLGIQYWDTSDDSYPGKIRSFGIGIGHQHFYLKGLYSTLQATPFLQNFYDIDDNKIQSGFQLWCQFRVGYRFKLFNDRCFLEPSVVINYWPINTNFPDDFKTIEDEWPNYFLLEPGLHFGFKF